MAMNRLLYIETVDSTNHFLKTHWTDFTHGTSVRAGFQTAGRGLAQNSWESDAGKNLLMSTLIFPQIPAAEQFKVNMLYVRGIYELLSQFQGIKIKWSNDIYYNDRKLGGILIEHGIEGEHIKYSICGIGLNINQTEFSNRLPNPVSLKQITGIEQDVTHWAQQIHKNILHAFETHEKESFEDLKSVYLKSLYRFNEKHLFKDNSGVFQAKIIDINPFGMLVLETDSQEIKVFGFKEIVFV